MFSLLCSQDDEACKEISYKSSDTYTTMLTIAVLRYLGALHASCLLDIPFVEVTSNTCFRPDTVMDYQLK